VEETLAKHEQMLDEWVERNLPGEGVIPETNRYREVVSGETIESRPRVQELLRRIESPRIKAILIVEPQRLSRGDLEDIGRIVKLLRYTNTLVITLQYTYDLRDDRDRDMFERELKRGNEFLEYTKRIMSNGRLLSVENGNYIGNYPPYGYRKIKYKDGKRKCYTLEPIPEEATVVKMIFEMYRDGINTAQIAKKLNDAGVKPAKGKKWARASLIKIRTNEHYIGKVVWNRRQKIKIVEDGEVIARSMRQAEYLVFPGKHPAIIDQELWDAVQKLRDDVPPVKRETKYANIFSGLIFCECGARMSRRTNSQNGKERSPARLVCANQKECGNASCLVDEMEKAVIGILREAIEDFELRIEHSGADQITRHQQLVAQQEKRLRELEKREIDQWDKYTREGMPKHIFEELNARVLEEKDDVQQTLCNLRDTLPELIDYEQKRVLFSDALSVLQNLDAPAREKNLLLSQCIDHIVYARKQKTGSRKLAAREPMELDVHLKV
jgi:DNA invertase Pin-like site-specific DNA recombinase